MRPVAQLVFQVAAFAVPADRLAAMISANETAADALLTFLIRVLSFVVQGRLVPQQ